MSLDTEPLGMSINSPARWQIEIALSLIESR